MSPSCSIAAVWPSSPTGSVVAWSTSRGASALADTLRFIAREPESLRPGGETVITRLADILVIQMVRHWVENEADVDRGWLAALRDDQFGRAIAAIHRDPGADWTLESLAVCTDGPAGTLKLSPRGGKSTWVTGTRRRSRDLSA